MTALKSLLSDRRRLMTASLCALVLLMAVALGLSSIETALPRPIPNVKEQIEVERMLSLAAGYQREGNYESALSTYQLLMERFPRTKGDATLVFEMAMAKKGLGRFSEAHGDFRRAADLDGSGSIVADATYEAAECLALAGMSGRAVPALEAALSAYPSNPHAAPALRRLGEHYRSVGVFDEAANCYRGLRRRAASDEDQAAAMDKLAAVLRDKGSYVEEAEVLRDAIDLSKEGEAAWAVRWMLLGDSLYQQEQKAAAKLAYGKALEGRPAFDDRIWSTCQFGACALASSAFEAAAEVLASLVAEYPAEDPTPEWRSGRAKYAVERAHFGLGDALFSLGDYREAVSAYAAAVERFPDSTRVGWALLRSGHCHRRLGDLTVARGAYSLIVSEHAGTVWAEQARAELDNLDWQGKYGIPDPFRPGGEIARAEAEGGTSQ